MSSVAVRLFKLEREHALLETLKGTHTHKVMMNIILLVTCNMGLFLAQLWKLSLPVNSSNHRQKYSWAPDMTETSRPDRGPNNMVRARGSTAPEPGHGH
jgi:hypothetical protein